jgi:hypothetical protein
MFKIRELPFTTLRTVTTRVLLGVQAEEKIVYLLCAFDLNPIDRNDLIANFEPAVLICRRQMKYLGRIHSRDEWGGKIVLGMRLNIDNESNKGKLSG